MRRETPGVERPCIPRARVGREERSECEIGTQREVRATLTCSPFPSLLTAAGLQFLGFSSPSAPTKGLHALSFEDSVCHPRAAAPPCSVLCSAECSWERSIAGWHIPVPDPTESGYSPTTNFTEPGYPHPYPCPVPGVLPRDAKRSTWRRLSS